MTKVKVLVLDLAANIGGGQTFILNTLSKLNFELYYILNNVVLSKILDKKNTFLICGENILRKKNFIENIISQIRPDCIIFNGGYAVYYSIFFHGSYKKIIYKHATHAAVKFYKRLLYHLILNVAYGFADKIIAVSAYCIREEHFLKKKFVCIHHGVENITEIKKENHIGIVFLYVGRITKEKGCDIICKEFNELNKDNIKLILVGDKTEADFDIKGYNSPKIKFVGFTSDPAKYYNKSDVFISLPKHEAFGLTLIEAMNYEMPVIATQVGGIPEIIIDGYNGVVIEKNRKFKEAIKKAFLLFIDNPDEVKRLGKNAKQSVEEKFLLMEKIRSIEKVILSLFIKGNDKN